MEKRRRVLGPDEEGPSDDFYFNVEDPKLPRNLTALREAERKFKCKDYKKWMHEVIDFSQPHPRTKPVSTINCPTDGWLRDGAEVYEVDGIPGFKMIPGALTAGQQKYWLERCFKAYMRPPNLNNLDALYEGLPSDGLYNSTNEIISVRRKGDDQGEVIQLPRLELLRRIRWTTLGYQYNWTTKEYDFDSAPNSFPEDLASLSQFTAESCGFGPQFRAEAGIVNYYQLGDKLTSHVDRSELTMAAPLLSVSLGASCVFLVGGLGRDDPVSPILLRSGDVSILSGPSRLYYHGVPKILPGTVPEYLVSDCEAIRDARININIRQVT